MGIDYNGVGGIGIEFSYDIVEKCIESNIFTGEDWEDDYDECFSKLGLLYHTAGNLMCDEGIQYVFVEGNNLKEIIENSKSFIEKFKKIGVDLSLEDLLVISDYRIS